MNGVALSLGAGTSLSPLELFAKMQAAGNYPPALTGMRGSHPGSFEVAHALAWTGNEFSIPKNQTDDTYDLVVVGAGISGLAAACLYRQKTSADARILLLDNHDDFGGHAKRNEFEVDGQLRRDSDLVLPIIAGRWRQGDQIEVLYMGGQEYDSVIISG